MKSLGSYLKRDRHLMGASLFSFFFAVSFFVLLATLLYWIGETPFASLGGLFSLFIIFALFLVSDLLFLEDFRCGILDQLVVEGRSLFPFVLSKIMLFFLTCAFPLAVLAPFLMSMYGKILWPFFWETLGFFLWSSFLFTLLCALGHALTLGALRQKGMMFLLILPFYIPIFLVEQGAFLALENGESVLIYGQLLGGLSLIYIPLGLWMTPATLKNIVIE